MTARKAAKSSTKLPRIVSLVVLSALALGVLWTAQAVQTALVPSKSMEPTLQVHDLLLVRKDAYKNGRTPQRGDIVLFVREGVPDYFVKRVIGLPGEHLIVGSGQVAVAGNLLEEPYVERQRVREYIIEGTVPEGAYFVMGDNRAHSEDSRDIGPVKLANIKGKVTAIISPKSRRGRIPNPFDE